MLTSLNSHAAKLRAPRLDTAYHASFEAARAASMFMDELDQRGLADVTRAHAHGILDRADEDLPVADVPRTSSRDDRGERGLDVRIGDHGDDADLGQKVDQILFGAPHLPHAALRAVTFDARDVDAALAQIGQRVRDVIESLGAHYGFDLLHVGCFRPCGTALGDTCRYAMAR